MPKVSIVIPIYNAGKYLEQCISSVLSQTLDDIEIICVDDGSTDNSGEILDVYAQKDNRIKVIHKENGGSVSARNVGVDIARGKYIGFVDSDDWIEPEMYEQLYALAEIYNVDLVTSGYYLEGNYTTIHIDKVKQGLYIGKEYEELLKHVIYKLDDKETGIRGSLCCKLFIKDKYIALKNKMSEQMTMGEDKMCVLGYMLDNSSAYIEKKAYYHYRINLSSKIHTANTEYLLAVNEVYQFFQTLYSHPKFTSEMRKQAEIYITELLIMGINTRMGFENQNLLWIDPYWLDKIPSNSKIVLYGAGELGKKYKRHLESKEGLIYVACVDPNFEKCSTEVFPVLSLECLEDLEYDYIVITIKNPTKASEVRFKLEELVSKEKILWFEQPEIFWKYAEADGLL